MSLQKTAKSIGTRSFRACKSPLACCVSCSTLFCCHCFINHLLQLLKVSGDLGFIKTLTDAIHHLTSVSHDPNPNLPLLRSHDLFAFLIFFLVLRESLSHAEHFAQVIQQFKPQLLHVPLESVSGTPNHRNLSDSNVS